MLVFPILNKSVLATIEPVVLYFVIKTSELAELEVNNCVVPPGLNSTPVPLKAPVTKVLPLASDAIPYAISEAAAPIPFA